MLITDSQRTALQTLIELTAHERALRFEYDNPKRAEELQELISRHKELGEKRTEAAAVVDGHQQAIAEATRLIEAQRSTIEKKTAELNDGTGLTSRDMVHLQEEIAGHESRVSELEESQLEELEKLEAAEDELAALDERITDVTASGKEVQTAVETPA